jgi:hypothetical protein
VCRIKSKRRYAQSAKGREAHGRYEASRKGELRRGRYEASTKGIVRRLRFDLRRAHAAAGILGTTIGDQPGMASDGEMGDESLARE